MSKTQDIKIIKEDIAAVRRNIKTANAQIKNIIQARDYLVDRLPELHKELWMKQNFGNKRK